MLNRLRIRFALWVAPELPNEVAIEKMTEVRQIALLEAVKICEGVAGQWSDRENQDYGNGVRWGSKMCAARIRRRAERSEMFAEKLRERSAERPRAR